MLNSNLLPASWRLLRYLNLGRVGQAPSGRVCYSLGISLCWAFGFLSSKVARARSPSLVPVSSGERLLNVWEASRTSPLNLSLSSSVIRWLVPWYLHQAEYCVSQLTFSPGFSGSAAVA